MKKMAITKAAALLGTMTVLTTGCTLTTDPDEALPQRYVETVTTSPAAKKLVGEKEARAAAAVATRFTMAHGTEEDLLDPQKTTLTAKELDRGVEGVLTPQTLKKWKSHSKQFAAGNEASGEQLRGLKVFLTEEPTWRRPDDGKIIQSQDITGIEVDAKSTATPKQLTVTMDHRTIAHYATDKNPVEAVVNRDVVYVMEKNGKNWQISEYQGEFELDSSSMLR